MIDRPLVMRPHRSGLRYLHGDSDWRYAGAYFPRQRRHRRRAPARYRDRLRIGHRVFDHVRSWSRGCVTIAIPVSMLAQTLESCAVNARFGHLADRYAAQGNTRMVGLMHLAGPTLLYF